MPMQTEVVRVDLEDVTLSCRVAGQGPVVVCAHGFPDEPGTFRGQIEPLVASGHTVVVPTMRGYAPSGVSKSRRYDPAALAGDLLALGAHFGGDAPMKLVGHDWGAIAAQAAAAKAPERVSHLVTIAVPHVAALAKHVTNPAQLKRSAYIALFQVPGVSDVALRANDLALVEQLFRAWSPGYAFTAEEMKAVKAAIRPRVTDVLAYYRALTDLRALGSESSRLLFAKVRVPTLHVHGANDGCIGIECCEGAEACFEAGYRMVTIDHAGHFVTREAVSALNDVIVPFLTDTPMLVKSGPDGRP
jgi:pimeloyl-ACP methyl ester carboxylesterase